MRKRALLILFPVFIFLIPIASATASDPTVTTFSSPNAQSDGFFGVSVAVSGNRVIVGARFETSGGFLFAGHAYVFNTTGSLIATLSSPNPQVNGEFGFSVAVSGNRVIVGAADESSGGFSEAGHAYIFSTTGSLIASLTSPNPQVNGEFGYSVAESGNKVIIGAFDESSGGFAGAGHAYIFSTTGSLIATLSSPNPQPSGGFGGGFGISVGVSGSDVVIGANGEMSGGFAGAGHAYVFSTTGSLITILTSPNPQFDGEFGFSVAVSGSRVLVGARLETAGGSVFAGHAYIFSVTGSLFATLSSPNPQYDGEFGFSVAMSGNRVLVGATTETLGGFVRAGQAYVFITTGSLIAAISSPNSQLDGDFGISVAVSGSDVVTGAIGEGSGGFARAGQAYLFTP